MVLFPTVVPAEALILSLCSLLTSFFFDDVNAEVVFAPLLVPGASYGRP